MNNYFLITLLLGVLSVLGKQNSTINHMKKENQKAIIIRDNYFEKMGWKSGVFTSDSIQQLYKKWDKRARKRSAAASSFGERLEWQIQADFQRQSINNIPYTDRKLPQKWLQPLLEIALDTSLRDTCRVEALDKSLLCENRPSDEFYLSFYPSDNLIMQKFLASFMFLTKRYNLSCELIQEINTKRPPYFIRSKNSNNLLKSCLEGLLPILDHYGQIYMASVLVDDYGDTEQAAKIAKEIDFKLKMSEKENVDSLLIIRNKKLKQHIAYKSQITDR